MGGLSRHRISSAIYYYLDNPSGGEAEYPLSTRDYLDDNWRAPCLGLEVRLAAVGDLYAELLAGHQHRVGYENSIRITQLIGTIPCSVRAKGERHHRPPSNPGSPCLKLRRKSSNPHSARHRELVASMTALPFQGPVQKSSTSV